MQSLILKQIHKPCSDCGASVSRSKCKSGLCRSCVRKGSRNANFGKPINLGRRLSPESQAKRIASIRGRKFPNISKSKQGMNNPNFGKPRPLSTRLKISASNKGKRHNFTPESLERIRLTQYKRGVGGAQHPQWRGGLTCSNTAIRNSDRYAEWREAVFERDYFTCQLCGKKDGGRLEAHHIVKSFADAVVSAGIKTVREAEEYGLFDVVLGVTLHPECHARVDEYRKRCFI